MNIKLPLVPIAVALSLSGISAVLLYILLKNNEDEYEVIDKARFAKYVTLEVKIPKESVGVVIGRGGSNIKQIQEETCTKISLKEEKEEEIYNRICEIRGMPEAAEKARLMIRNIIMNQPLITTRETFVPESACGRIIGKNGTNIRNISSASSARIQIDRYSSSRDTYGGNVEPERRVVIKGTEEQIELAIALIKEKVEEDREIRSKMQESIANRSPRKPDKALCLTAAATNDSSSSHKSYVSEKLNPAGGDGYIPVFVSALTDPGCFFVQLVGQHAVELDHLVEEMTQYYSKEENQEIHRVNEISVGQLVAAPFTNDEMWYRAIVRNVTLDEYDPKESDLLLFYLDYGDSADVKQKQVFHLRTDFLRLRFQAIECCLANVKPKDDQWSEEARELMEDLCHVAQWVVIMARVDGYRERPRTDQRQEREGSPVPCVSLVNTTGPKDVPVAAELVKRDLAEWEKPVATETSSSANNNIAEKTVNGITNSESSSRTSNLSYENSEHKQSLPLLPDSDSDEESDLEIT
ncbi:tudor and KH domain-containing protein homolog [Schistocerca nitens]|uniref:tudor and KH domain-containing protein homolog n=1 Tax=Schistocerca nitens TaxID=7011 RepID=UPI002117CC5F|nr:tudor and KH domain-containing protein homolog [Schistocerca nitens]